MSFAYWNRTGHVTSYDGARRVWERAKPWRGETGPLDERPFDGRSRNRGVRRTEEGAYIFRYHRTDVVEWVSPDEVMVDMSYRSQSTNAFAAALLPRDVSVHVDVVRGVHIDYVAAAAPDDDGRFGHRFWRVDGSESIYLLRANGLWAPTRTMSWVRRTVDRTEHNAAMRAAGANEFIGFGRAFLAMRGGEYQRYASPSWHTIRRAMVGDRDAWKEFWRAMAPHALRAVEKSIRHNVAIEANTFHVQTEDVLTSHSAVARFRAAEKKYGRGI